MFKAGNKVRCIDDGDYKNLTEGVTYEITSVDDEGYVSLIGDCGDYGEYLPSRFELIEEEKTMTKQNKDFTGLKVGDMLTRRGAQMNWWTEGAKYEVFGDEDTFWITDDVQDKHWFTVEKDGTVSNNDVQRGFYWDKPEKKMYKEEDIYAGMKLECVSNGGFTHWTEGKVYEVNDNLKIYSDIDTSRSVPTILQYLNEVEDHNVMFKVVEKKAYTLDDLKVGMVLRCTDDKGYDFWTTGKEYTVYRDNNGVYIENEIGDRSYNNQVLIRLNGKGSNATMEVVSTPEPQEAQEPAEGITLTITGDDYYKLQENLEAALNLVEQINYHTKECESSIKELEQFKGGK